MATLTTLFIFNGNNDQADGALPASNLITDANGDLFGTTQSTVFEIAKTAGGYASTPTVLAANFNELFGGLITDANGDLFGTAGEGGTSYDGTVFEIAKTASGYASAPTVLATFNGSDGATPQASLIANANGDLFGTTTSGGTSNNGTVFEIADTAGGYAGTPTVLVSFNGSDGSRPFGGLIADANGDLFGTTRLGGTGGRGEVFEIAKTASGYATTPTVLASFNGTNGDYPIGGLFADANGDLFGTASQGGPNGDGTVFEIAHTANGYASATTVLVSFNGTDGADPNGSLIADANGDLFGTTVSGGTSNNGTVFEIVNSASGYAGTPTVLVNFDGTDGGVPVSSLLPDANGDLFGTSQGSGRGDIGFSGDTVGTVFEVTDSGYQTAASAPDTVSITGVPAGQTITDAGTIVPFAGTTVSDTQGQSFSAYVVVQDPAGGTLSFPGDPFDVTADGSTFITGGTAAQITAALQQLLFVPAVLSSAATTGLSLEVQGLNAATLLASAQTAVTATPVSDPLTITTLPANIITAVAGTGTPNAFAPFKNIAITDGTPNAMDAVTITLSVNGAPSDANGTLSGTGLTRNGPGTYQLAAAAPATEQATLQALALTISNPGVSTTTTATLQVSNGVSSPATDTDVINIEASPLDAGSVNVTNAAYETASTNTTSASQTTQSYATTIQAVLNGTRTVYDQTFALPYSDPALQAAVTQADAALEGDGATPGQPTLTGSTPTASVSTSTTPTGSTTEANADPTTIIQFGPAVIGPNVSFPDDNDSGRGYFDVYQGEEDITETASGIITNNQTVTTTTNDLLSQTYTISGSAPDSISITGVPAGQTITDVGTIAPFAGATVSDTQGAGFVAFVVVQNETDGTLSDPDDPAAVSVGGTTAVFRGTAAQITSALQQLVYAPAVQSSTAATELDLEIENPDTGALLDLAQTSVTGTPVSDPLTITTDSASVIPYGGITVAANAFTLFSNIEIADGTPGAMDAIAITLDVNGSPSDANGILTGPGLTKTGAGTYKLAAASPVAEHEDLQAVVFTIADPSVAATTTATLTISNGVSPPATDTYVFSTGELPPGPVTLSTTYENGSTFDTTANSITENYKTEVRAVNGTQIVFDQTFDLPYADPTVQAAVAQADADLQAVGVTPGQPGLTASTSTPTSVTTTTTPTGSTLPQAGGTTTNYSGPVNPEIVSGPAVFGPNVGYLITNGAGGTIDQPIGYVLVPSGEQATDDLSELSFTNNLLTTTTTNDLLSQTYTIANAALSTTGGITIAGVPAGQTITDVGTIVPFTGTTVSDTLGTVFAAFVVVQNPADGTLALPTDADSLPPISADGSTAMVGGTAAEITAELQKLAFVPTVQSSAATTGLSLEIEDENSYALLAAAQTAVTATPVADPLTIRTLPANRTPGEVGTGATNAFTPFNNIAITDGTPGALDTVTITLDVNGAPSDANGTLSGSGLTQTGPGTYTLAAASPATEQAELQALAFTAFIPPGIQAVSDNGEDYESTTAATLTVSNGVSPPATDAYAFGTGAVSGAVVATGESNLIASTDTAAATATTQSDETTISAILNGTQTVFDQTFDLPYSDPAVQAAIATADADLENAGATPSQPVLTSSTPTTSVTTPTTPAGSTISVLTPITTTQYGPAAFGPNAELPAANANGQNGVFGYPVTLPGQEFLNVVTPLSITNEQTVTTTTNTLLSQTYTISGNSQPASTSGATGGSQPPSSSGATGGSQPPSPSGATGGSQSSSTSSATASAQTAIIVSGLLPFAGLGVASSSGTATPAITATLTPAVPGIFSNLGGGTLDGSGAIYTTEQTAALDTAALGAVTFGTTENGFPLLGVSATINGAAGGTSALIDAGSGTDFLTAGAGNDTLLALPNDSTLTSGPGNDLLSAMGASDTLIGGAGAATMVGGGANTVFVLGNASQLVFDGGGAASILGGNGADTIVGLSGNDTVTLGTGGNLVGFAQGNNFVTSVGLDTLIAGAGMDTINASGDALGFGGNGALIFNNGAGISTVFGASGAGSDTIGGGAGGGLFGGGRGGKNFISAGQLSSTLFGVGGGDTLLSAGSAADVLVAGAGNETLGAASAGGANIFFDGTGADLVNTGAGNAVVVAGAGNATVNMGSGADQLVFVNGQAGGAALVNGFVPGTDSIAVQRYAGNATVAAANASVANNAITFTLPDNTTITLAGVTSLANVFA